LYQLIQQTKSKSTHSSLINKQTQTESTKGEKIKITNKIKTEKNQIKPVLGACKREQETRDCVRR
jgi:hypothetical protein